MELGKTLRVWWRGLGDLWFREGTIVRGSYKVLRNLGGGSYGVAYLCQELAANKLCVLKRVRPLQGGLVKAEAIYRRETAMLSRLNHPAIPKLLEGFRYRGQLCFTMEAVAGKSIEQLLFHEEVRFTEKDSLEIIRSLVPVVAYLHDAGMVHRDIHISNVMLTRDAEATERPTVKLIDFGLARELAPASDPNAPSEETEAEAQEDEIRPGDPPDRALRRKLTVDSDFYGLGHLLLFLLYSTFPEPAADTGPGSSWEEELSLHPNTKRLLRRMLQTEQPYSHISQIASDLNQILGDLKS